MLLRIDSASATPLFAQLADQVRAQILSGVLAKGERLPSARELAEALEVNLHTVLHAYQELRDEGMVELRRGRGAIVTGSAVDHGTLAAQISSLVADARALGATEATLQSLIREEFRR